LQCKTNRNLGNHMWPIEWHQPIPMTLSDFKGHFCCLKPFLRSYLGKCGMCYLQHVYSRTASIFRCYF